MDKFSFEYCDSKNELKIKLILDVNSILQDPQKDMYMNIFNIAAEFWVGDKKYTKDEFNELVHSNNFELKPDFGLGGEFGYFCGYVCDKIKTMGDQSRFFKNEILSKGLNR